MTNPLEDTTNDTLEAITKAQTSGILESTGAYSYDLTGVVELIPVITPLRDKVAREQSPNGAPFAIWRAFMDVTKSQPSPLPGFDYAGNEVLFSEQDFQAKYQPLALAGLVTQDAFDTAKGLFDPYANATFQVLNQFLIAEDKVLMGGQSFNLPQPSVPTLVQSASGGTIGAVQVYVAVAARTGFNYYYGGNSRGASANTTFGSGSTNSVTASIPAVKGATAYDWFYSANGSTWFYVRTTTVSTTVISAVQGSAGAVGGLTLPDLFTGLPTLNLAADNGSGVAASPDGLIATLTGDYTSTGQWATPNTATANPAVYMDNGGAALTLSGGSFTQLNTAFTYLWNAVKTSPTAIMVNAALAQEMANLLLASPSAVTYLQTDESGRINITAGGRVGAVINTPAGGLPVPIEVHTALPPGTIILRTDRVPFPQAQITNVLAVRTLRDTAQFDYATGRIANTAGGGPRKEFEIRSVEAFINRAPVSMAIIENVA